MKPCKSFCPLSFIILSLILGFGQSGCGRTVERTAVKNGISPPNASMTGSIRTARQDLSMAKTLKRVPSSDYIVGPEDTLEISVFRHNDLKMEATISATGKISYYLIGDIQAAGMTQFGLREEIQKKLSQFIKDPKVFIRITDYGSHKIFVLGQVNKPGVYRMKNDFTLLEAVSSAGGVSPNAYLGGAYVVRDEKILLVNFVELIEKGITEENIPLLPGDTIYIPDNRDHRVFVLGEVNKQAAIPIRQGLTLLEAIAEAGGFTRDAKKNSILVMRGNLSEPEIMEIDSERMDIAAGLALERGDIVYVATSSFANLERIGVGLSHILMPLYTVARTIVWGDAAAGVMEGKDSKFIIPDD